MIGSAIGKTIAVLILTASLLACSGSDVTYWECGAKVGKHGFADAVEPRTGIQGPAWHWRYWTMKKGEPLENSLFIWSDVPVAAWRGRAAAVAENLEIPDGNRSGFIIAFMNGALTMEPYSVSVDNGRYEPTVQRMERFGELLKSEMIRSGSTPEQAYACVMPEFVRLIVQGTI